jgi:hypothetical protein
VRTFKRIIQAVGLIAALALAWSLVFIGLECYSPATPAEQPGAHKASALEGHVRDEVSTFLTLPEWYIVYNTEEYARFLESQAPSRFPYVGSIRQYWRYYGAACRATSRVYPFSVSNHLMLAVIGLSFTAEYIVKGLYENLVGRATEWIAGRDTPEDAYGNAVATEYGKFMHTMPWYQFPFRSKLAGLWTETPLWGGRPLRKWERKLALSAEYGGKAVYAWLIGGGTRAAYASEDLRIYAWIENAGDEIFEDGAIQKVEKVSPRSWIVTIPRYEAFTTHALLLSAQGVRFVDIAGNDDILLTVLTSTSHPSDKTDGVEILREPLLTDPETSRLAIKARVSSLHDVLDRIQRSGARVEHLYDY